MGRGGGHSCLLAGEVTEDQKIMQTQEGVRVRVRFGVTGLEPRVQPGPLLFLPHPAELTEHEFSGAWKLSLRGKHIARMGYWGNLCNSPSLDIQCLAWEKVAEGDICLLWLRILRTFKSYTRINILCPGRSRMGVTQPVAI